MLSAGIPIGLSQLCQGGELGDAISAVCLRRSHRLNRVPLLLLAHQRSGRHPPRPAAWCSPGRAALVICWLTFAAYAAAAASVHTSGYPTRSLQCAAQACALPSGGHPGAFSRIHAMEVHPPGGVTGSSSAGISFVGGHAGRLAGQLVSCSAPDVGRLLLRPLPP